MVLDVTQQALGDGGHRPPRHRVHRVGQLRLPRRSGVRVRADHRGDRRVAADLRVARRDGRRVGDVRGVHPPAGGRHRPRPRVQPRALVAGQARGRSGRCSSTRTTSRRSASTRRRSPRCRRARCSTPGKATERDFAEIVARNRGNAVGNEYAQVSGTFDVDALLAEPYVRNPLRRHDLPPISDGAAAVVLAAGDQAASLVDRPAWISGIDHRIDIHQPGMRDLTESPSIRARGRRPPASGRARSRWPRSRRRSRRRRWWCATRSGSATTWSSTRRAARSPPTR